MHPKAREWVATHTWSSTDFPEAELYAAKSALGLSVSVVIPARDEAATIGGIVSQVRTALMGADPLVDELIVIDSDSDDDTGTRARLAGARVHRSADVRPDLGSHRGKGEAIWKSLFVSNGDLLVFLDADVTTFTPRYVTGLLGPLLRDSTVQLVKGFYDRDLADDDSVSLRQGGRVTELTARPVLNMWWPELAGIIQPLAGEWACRRTLIEAESVPVGYGVEIASLIDTYERAGLDALAQVDLGSRRHSHQDLIGLSSMAAEILATADRRRHPSAGVDAFEIVHFTRAENGNDDEWESRPITTVERPPALRESAAC